MKKLLLVTAALLFVQLASAEDFSTIKCLPTKETAEELVDLEVSGRQHMESTCLTQENFPRLRVGPNSSPQGDTVDKRKPVILTGKKPYEILSITKDKDERHLVKFEYKLSNGKKIKDQLEFVEYPSGELKKLFGCASIVAAPQTIAIHQACLPTRKTSGERSQ